MRRRYMSSKSTLFNILPVISFNPKDTTSYIGLANFFNQDGNQDGIVSSSYINDQSFQLVDYYQADSTGSPFDIKVNNSSYYLRIAVKTYTGFNGLCVYKVSFIDGSREFYVALGNVSYVSKLGYSGLAITNVLYLYV